MKTTKIETVVIIVLILVVAGLSVIGYRDYTYRSNTTTKQTQSIIDQRDLYKTELLKSMANEQNQKAQITELTTEKGQFCAELHTAKVNEPLCVAE